MQRRSDTRPRLFAVVLAGAGPAGACQRREAAFTSRRVRVRSARILDRLVRLDRLTDVARSSTVVRLSSKGQLVIPAALRRKLGLKTGQVLTVRGGGDREIVITLAETDSRTLERALRRARSWATARRRDLVDELHQRRRRERERQVGRR